MGIIRNIYRHIKPVINRGQENDIRICTKMRNSTITINGDRNHVEIGKNCVINNCEIQICGNDNRLIIKDTARLLGGARIIMGGDATIIIGENAGVRKVDFVAKDAKIEVGALCMFSNNIVLRNHDSHKVLLDGEVVNPAKDIILGRHVWIGQNVTILKGVEIGENSIIAFGAVVTKGCPMGSIIAGNPGKIVKKEISWDY